jgi:diguanylate cyclase (GGDEF)-like protein
MHADNAHMDPQEEIARLKEQVARLTLFTDVGKALASSLDSRQVLQTIMEKISDLLQPDTWSLLMLDEKGEELAFEVAVGEGAERLKDVTVKVGEGIAGWVAEHAESVLVEDVRSDTRFSSRFDAMTGTHTRSVVCVPIVGRGGVLGVIELINSMGKASFREQDLPILRNLADYAAIALENARFVAKINELTITDDTTRLYNARHLQFVLDTELYRSRRYGFPLSVVFLDLDHFKTINDTYGHLAGSRLLWLIGDVLRSHMRLIDTAFRYGGDEFVLLLPQTPKEKARQVVERLRELLETTAFLQDDGIDTHVTASFGISTFPDDGETKKELIARADEAMYAAKSGGRNAVVLAGGIDSAPSSPA